MQTWRFWYFSSSTNHSAHSAVFGHFVNRPSTSVNAEILNLKLGSKIYHYSDFFKKFPSLRLFCVPLFWNFRNPKSSTLLIFLVPAQEILDSTYKICLKLSLLEFIIRQNKWISVKKSCTKSTKTDKKFLVFFFKNSTAEND